MIGLYMCSDESLHGQNVKLQDNNNKKNIALLNIILILLSTFGTLKWETMNKNGPLNSKSLSDTAWLKFEVTFE